MKQMNVIYIESNTQPNREQLLFQVTLQHWNLTSDQDVESWKEHPSHQNNEKKFDKQQNCNFP